MDTTVTKQGPASNAGPASDAVSGTPITDTKTYTQEQLDKAVVKAKSDALSAAGRTDKDHADTKADLDAREATIADREAEQDRIALDGAKGDPAKMAEYQANQAAKKVRDKLAEDKAKLKADRAEVEADKVKNAALVEAAQVDQREKLIYEVAATFEINPAALKTDIANLGLQTEEQIKTYAQRLTGKEPPEPDPKKKKIVDSGVTSGSAISTEGKTSRQIFSDHFAETQKKK